MLPSGMFDGRNNASAATVKKRHARVRSTQKLDVSPLESALPRFANHCCVTPIESMRKSRFLSLSANCTPLSLADTTLTNSPLCNPSRMNTSEKIMGVPTPRQQLTSFYSMTYANNVTRDSVRNALLDAWVWHEPHQRHGGVDPQRDRRVDERQANGDGVQQQR